MFSKQALSIALAGVFLSVLLITCKKPEPELFGQIQGAVKSTGNLPIEGATLKINTSPSETAVFTKADGTYIFANLSPQTYQISVSKDGFTSNTQNVTVTAGETKTLDFALIPSTPTITVTMPTSATNWNVGTQQTLTWTWSNISGTVKIELLKSGILSKIIESSTENDGSYVWTLPTDLSTASDYKVKITSLSNAAVFDESDNFTINVPQITLPTVTTTAVSSIAQTSATAGGNVTADGGAAVTARGICWSTTQNPTTSNNKTTDGSETGTFTSSLSSLTANTTYYVRAYATNSVGTAYGTEVQFTTAANTSTPSVSTTAVSSIAQTTATTGGNVTADGGSAVTARGVCYSTTNQTPTVADSKTTDGSGTGTFTSNLSSLTANATYYVRAYATNANGTSYGNMVSFTTLAGSTLPTNGLVAYYPFNGNANDESGNGNNGTVNGATMTADRKGNVNKAYSFDGSNSIVLNQPFLTGVFSLSIWVKITDLQPGVWGAIFSNGILHGYGNGFNAWLSNKNENIYFNKFPNGTSTGPSKAVNINDNLFHNFIFVWDGLTGLSSAKIYHNGSLLATGEVTSTTINSTWNLTFGFSKDSGLNFYFKGMLDDIRLYNRALTETEIQQLYNE